MVLCTRFILYFSLLLEAIFTGVIMKIYSTENDILDNAKSSGLVFVPTGMQPKAHEMDD